MALLRDIFNPSFQNIYVNDADIYHNIRDYVSLIAPGREEIVQRYTGELPNFDNFAITKQIKSLFGRTCLLYTSDKYILTYRLFMAESLFLFRLLKAELDQHSFVVDVYKRQ